MSDPPKPGAVLFAKDVERVARFYERLAALTVQHRERDLIVLESPSFQLVIHGIPSKIATSIVIGDPPTPRVDLPVKLILPVASLVAAREAAASLGGGLHSDRKAFEARGFRACDGFDPEGNVVQFRETARPPRS